MAGVSEPGCQREVAENRFQATSFLKSIGEPSMSDSPCYRQLTVHGGEFLHTGRLIRIDCGPVGPKRESSPLVNCSRCYKLEKPLAERRNPKRSPSAVL
jgi:hypothetical protein